VIADDLTFRQKRRHTLRVTALPDSG
jgi:hypothetical protein